VPGPIPHGLFAREYQLRRPELDARAVIRGAEFADIRRMAGLPREKTHWTGVALPEIDSERDAWQVGLLLHNYLDERWNEFMQQFGLVPSRPEDEDMWLALKLAEDRTLHSQSVEYQLGQYFDGSPDEHELALGVSAEMIVSWDAWVKWKLTAPFERNDWLSHVEEMGFAVDEVERVAMMSDDILADRVWLGRFDMLHAELGYGQA
jgi:hypothetical protein